MNFGFSPGDVVMFVQFGAKVAKALREQSGSQAEYQLADFHCQGFLRVMDEMKQLDLSGVPERFRKSIEECSNDVCVFVQEFKATIGKYEKSMGKTSERGKVAGAPRKVQWAFAAAEDLSKFRQSLAAQLDIVKITIQTSIL